MSKTQEEVKGNLKKKQKTKKNLSKMKQQWQAGGARPHLNI